MRIDKKLNPWPPLRDRVGQMWVLKIGAKRAIEGLEIPFFDIFRHKISYSTLYTIESIVHTIDFMPYLRQVYRVVHIHIHV